MGLKNSVLNKRTRLSCNPCVEEVKWVIIVYKSKRKVTIRFIHVCVHSRSPVALKLKENTVKTIVMVQCFAPDSNHQSESHMHVQIFYVSLSRVKSR